MAVDVVRPIEEAQAVKITQCKTRRGGFQFYLNQVRHAWIHECVEVTSVMADPVKLSVIGFIGTGEVCLDDEEEEQQQRLAHVLWTLVCSVLGEYILVKSMYCMSPPWCWATLVSPESDERKMVLNDAAYLWQLWDILEDQSRSGCAPSTSFLKDMLWTRMVFSRGILLSLRGVHFKGVPVDSVEQPLRKLFSCWSSTQIVEDAINVEKLQSMSQSGTHKCGELFGQLLATNLLEAADRPQPSVDADTLAASRALFKIPRKMISPGGAGQQQS